MLTVCETYIRQLEGREGGGEMVVLVVVVVLLVVLLEVVCSPMEMVWRLPGGSGGDEGVGLGYLLCLELVMVVEVVFC